uniref:Dynein heavy chain linker domain-containing protein n=1 Tax=Glossina austeni TaxID=7395 RepID=A0A1A9VTS0_GLOAU
MARRSKASSAIFKKTLSVQRVDSAEIRRTNIYSSSILKAGAEGVERASTPCQYSGTAVLYNELKVTNEQLTPHSHVIETAQKWLNLEGKNNRIHRFPLKTILPKVQMTRVVLKKHLPRDVEVERRRKQYAKINLEAEFEKAGLSANELMPTEEQYYILSENAFEHFLPLSFFDDSNYDTHSPTAWLKLGQIENGEFYPLPAKAFLPVKQSLIDYQWQFAAIQGYDDDTGKWTAMNLSDEHVYEIPKVQVMFMAENPYVFVERLKKAVQIRNDAETVIMLETIVDCVMLQDISELRIYPNKLVDRLMSKVKTDPTFFNQLNTEVYLVFEHLMACYEFEKFVKLLPKEFPKFTGDVIRNSLPKAFASKLSGSERRFLKSLNIKLKERRTSVLTYSLYYTKGGIEAMQNPLFLNDFLQAQNQNSSHVSNYLKAFWPSKISAGVTIVLRALGKGWLDITLDKWSVYQICKISRFITQVKFRMQESMHVLLEKSITNFSQFLCDPCMQFLNITNDYKWTNDYIETEFPFPKAIFSLILSVSEDGKVVFNTNPEDFQIAMKQIFKKSLEKSNAVRCIDAETLINLRFAPNLFILTVELIEELYLQCDDLMQRCYAKAIIPLISYSHKYDHYVDFYLLNVQQYMQNYKAAKMSSMQVKNDILEHKREKEELRDILPPTIIIGPFLVIVDPMKQHMIRKRIEIIKKIFEYYVDRMYDINERLIERCTDIYNKIHERPQSIEHLYDIREFAQTVPEIVDQVKADTQIMVLEYDMLDAFFYNLPDHQFAMKWEAVAWPKTIIDRLSTLREEQKVDIEDFKRLHLSECVGFEERLESLNDEVQAFSLMFIPEKVVETANDIKKTWRTISDLQKLGETLYYRQELFELEPLSLDFLNNIIESFTPYKNLWYSCLDLVKLEEATIGNPLVNVEMDEVWKSLETIKESLEKSLIVFEEKPEIQDVATYFLAQWEAFIPTVRAIEDMKNENWLFMHWQELANRSGLDIKYSLAMNFQYLMRKGLMDYLDLVHEIGVKAVDEADAIRLAMEEEERRKEEEQQALILRKASRKCRTDILDLSWDTVTILSPYESSLNLIRFAQN